MPIVARLVVRNLLHVEHVYPNMDVVGVMNHKNAFLAMVSTQMTTIHLHRVNVQIGFITLVPQ